MRIGTTSYIFPADILTNVQRLAHRVDDVELVIFEVDDAGTELPDQSTIDKLNQLAGEHDLTYTVHLPLDLALASDSPQASLEKALRVIRSTAALSPYAFIVHVERGEESLGARPERAVDNAVRSLEALATKVGGCTRLCVENSEPGHFEIINAILEKLPVSCCVDAGHVWKERLDPVPLLERLLPKTRVIHLHGVGHRDHQALSLVSTADLDPVIALLRGFEGVLTLEVFNEQDLADSLMALEQSLRRVGISTRT
ncbi:MAG: cobamide remodeling phosphodiesterase CbiR [Thermodesulfobacteriota bacterium]